MTLHPRLKTERTFSYPLVIFLIGFASQLAVLIRFSHSQDFIPKGDDMQFYSDWALRIAQGQWTDGKAFYGLPGYAFLLAAFYALLGYNPFAVGLVQAILFSLTAVLIYRLAFLVFPKGNPRQIGALAALGWIFFLPAQTFSVILMPTIWALVAYWACVAWLLRTRPTSPVWAWFCLGLVMGITSMMVATILLLTPLVIVSIWLQAAPRMQPWSARFARAAIAAALFGSGVFAGSAPAALHNHLIAHDPVMLSAHSGINLWIGNNPQATGYPKMPPGIRASQAFLLQDSIKMAEQESGRPLTRAAVSAFWSNKAHTYIREHPGEWSRLIGRKFLNFWNTYPYDDLSSIKLFRSEGITWPGLCFGWIAALGLTGMVFACREEGGARMLGAAVLLHMLALMPMFITERYRLAAVPGLLLFAAWYLSTLWAALARQDWLRVSMLSGTAFGAAVLVSIPRNDPTLWALDYYKEGIYAIEANDLERAETNLQMALNYSPMNAEVYFALGNLFSQRKDTPRAKACFRQALELNPRHDGVLNNLGVLALAEKRWELAERFFQASIASDPEDAKTYYLLARARFERGDIAGAQAALHAALQLRPGEAQFLEFQSKLGEP